MFRLDTGSEADFARTTEKAIATGGFPRPRAMLLAVAGPPVGKRAELSNAEVAGGRLTVDGDALAAALGLEQGLLFNDFELCRSRCPSSRRRMSSGWMRGRRPPIRQRRWSWWGRVPGSASADLVPVDGRWLPVSGEGGHVMLGPATPDELLYWPHLGGLALSAEDLVSGRGLSRLYRASAASLGVVAQDDAAPAVAERALAGTEPAAADAVRRLS